LALNCGLRDKEIRSLQWGRIYLDEAYLVVGQTKTAGGTGRTIPLNRTALAAVKEYPPRLIISDQRSVYIVIAGNENYR
jgi:integrase